ncbi:hypothetical protein RFI_29796 [Reticulomyxa filosa]|uniref:Uncharacterized protein n=1 Tax=Reticulomyxa filosa TaxID=46433 RepID=X6M3J5_RETFI|nr:hypothetical protein RFI_29796 [Reticulomyxa filosa]|eukprot:ETO07595.1 hypothetical protein RFI_29796 [Reticulomyxa filosa]
MHCVVCFRPHIPPLSFDKDASAALKYNKSDKKWHAFVNNNATGAEYRWNEIRASVAYRGWCFKNKEEADKFDPKEFTSKLTLDMVIDRLTENLISKGLVTREKVRELKQPNTKDKNNAYELGLLLLDNYIKLPYPHGSYIPYNYCLLFKLFPQLDFAREIESAIC